MAHWIEHEHLFSGRKYECSACGAEFSSPQSRCPRCNRNMKGKGKYKPDYAGECFLLDLLDV